MAVFFPFLLLTFPLAEGQDGPSSRIFDTIINNATVYNKDSPPWETGPSVNVLLSDYFTVLISVEENQQLVKYIANLNITWNDHRLVWNSTEMGTRSVQVPPGRLWTPLLNMYNCVNLKDLKEQWEATTLQVSSSGSVSLQTYSYVETICAVNVEPFPFDQQWCGLSFSTILAPIGKYRIVPVNQKATNLLLETLVFTGNFTTENETYSLGQVLFRLKRNPEFYIYFLILPTFTVTSLCIAALLLPIELELGERINMGIAGLLGLTFLLSVIIGELPRSPGLPLLGKWVIMEMFFCCGSMLVPMAVAVLEKRLLLRKRKWAATLVEGGLFLLVTLANTITSVLLFVIPPKNTPPTSFTQA